MSKPTQKDAELMIELFALGFTPEMKKAWNWVIELKKQKYEDFIKKNPIGSEGWNNFTSIASVLELVGILVKYGTINEDMTFDCWYTAWEKLGPLVKGFQKETGQPRFFENYEYLAKKSEEWRKQHPPLFTQ